MRNLLQIFKTVDCAVLTTGLLLSTSCSTSTNVVANRITFVATEYMFLGPTELPAGLTTLLLTNKGQEIHWMEMYRLAEGRALDDFQHLVQDTQLGGALPSWASAVGGPGWIPPGDASNVTVYLERGHYVLLCRFPTAEGIPHTTKGMTASLHVAPTLKPPMNHPPEDVVLAISDSAFELSGPLRAGLRTIRVENVGSYRHEVYVFQLAPGKSIEDYRAWEQGGLRGAGPGRPLGGVTPFERGQRLWFTATFTMGVYVFGDESGGGPDIFRQVTVQ